MVRNYIDKNREILDLLGRPTLPVRRRCSICPRAKASPTSTTAFFSRLMVFSFVEFSGEFFNRKKMKNLSTCAGVVDANIKVKVSPEEQLRQLSHQRL